MNLVIDSSVVIKWFVDEIEYVPSHELIQDALQIATQHQRTVYDALYLTPSEKQRYVYVTADQKFVNSVQNAFKGIISLAGWKTKQDYP